MRPRRIAHLGLFVAIALSGAPAASVMAAQPLDESPPSGTLDLFPESGLNANSGYTPISSILARVSTTIDADGLDKLRISNTGAASGGMLTTYENDQAESGERRNTHEELRWVAEGRAPIMTSARRSPD